MRIIVLNVYFPPQAFGGATIVADQTTRLLAEGGDEVLVITSDQSGRDIPGTLHRYEWDGIPVIAASVPAAQSTAYKNETFAARFADICDSFRPDVVLTHCVQGMGASYLEHCESRRIPSVIFIHDTWWLCERHFMINRSGAYCHQRCISQHACHYCVDDPGETSRRDHYLRKRLTHAHRLLLPSQFIRDLHVASGLPSERCKVVHNGVVPPRNGRKPPRRRRNQRVRFGFVGGTGPMKGGDHLSAVFRDLERSDYELVCVDNLTNLGLVSHQFANWAIGGTLRIRQGYTQSTIDQFFSEIDVLLFPSQCKESFGLAVREALIRGKWVISTDGGGTTEAIVNGVNGRIIPLGVDLLPLRQAVLECFQKDWNQHRNPHAAAIVTFDQQTAELRSHLLHACEDSRRVVKSDALPASFDNANTGRPEPRRCID
jgi:glycosyltransferase involved in cell wall biosynthesis